MKAIVFAVIFVTCLTARTAEATDIWDALPAIEPLHLRGAYVGQRICPICTHGYDAGILLVVRSSLPIDTARDLARNLAPTQLGVSSTRFRVFVVITGEPTLQLVSALNHEDPTWFVTSLNGDALAKAESAFGTALRDSTRGYVFAQRRLLHELSVSALTGDDAAERRSQAQYAMQLLDRLHPRAIKGAPQGAMWFAPTHLTSVIDVQPRNGASGTLCITTPDGSSVSNALARLELAANDDRWGRTDQQGCITVRGVVSSSVVQLYKNLQPPLRASLNADELAASNGKLQLHAVQHGPTGNERIVGLPCDGCENVFDGVPTSLTSMARIAPADEPGELLRLRGRILNSEGTAAPGVVVYAYQTNHAGIYARTAGLNSPLKLRGWAISDEDGSYAFDTIRPGSYPGRDDPAHIHMHIIEVGRCTYYIDDVKFRDDPRLTGAREKTRPRGGSGVTDPKRDAQGRWQVTRDIYLGRNVPGYEGCAG